MLIIILDNIRSLYNVGSCFRTCDGFGVDKVYLCGLTGVPPKKEISKTALGAEQSVDWEYVEDINSLILKLKKDDFEIVSFEKTSNSQDIASVRWAEKTAMVFGNEIVGVSDKVLLCSDKIVHISMKGVKESFNVASCVAVAVYDYMGMKN